ncbi:hypothetical protein PHET_00488 [Paragonimus heterotremus]|uniref:UPF0506 domain-containing protein n=1 Tax=Paragonimus heterotremus TaxID=100268 RepID=A0A8J4TEV7_9TREM|nr:hypothetical protein PHET_00488 [Paragonimus heterotremus]
MRFFSRRLVNLTLYCYLFVTQVLFLPENETQLLNGSLFRTVTSGLFIYHSATAKCVGLNGACDGTIAFRCCGDLKCELHGAFRGKCKTCIAAGFPCTLSSQCCSRRCSALNCMEF